ncbi:competence protein ComQ [Amphibacillus marinus]|uniref:Competence protein ComQ n=1 Tax=Amphibacillus marinus TaxID=872970 RepID=A0A1H8KC29_9BACI|nr:polyprenyl synthetase family protein [Amphibacillus marinus]SEN90530.1 competence protein ComQ [Amphibacillus marinus]
MRKFIRETIKDQVRSSFNLDEIQSLAMDFFDYQAKERDFLFAQITVLHYKMFNGEEQGDIYQAAAAVEMLALASDILDDLQDQDNVDAPWRKLDSSLVTNIAVGLFLLGKQTLDLYTEISEKLASKLFYSAIFSSLVGQHLDLKNDINNEGDYFQVVKNKTALIRFSSLIGATMAKAQDVQINIIRQYAEKMGIISQLLNDLNDLYHWEKKSDISSKKKTLPILYMLDIPDQSIIKTYYQTDTPFSQIYSEKQLAIQEMELLGAMRYTKTIIALERIKALQQISKLDISSAYKEQLTRFF